MRHKTAFVRQAELMRGLVLPVLIALLCSAQAAQAQVVDRSTLTSKVMCGYQGWHCCLGDGNPPWIGWNHWSKQADYIGPGKYNVDVWPDTREYDASDLFPCGSDTVLTYGGAASLFSSYRQGAVNVHFRWMQENNIDGVFHQRFVGGYVGDPTESWQHRIDVVLQNVMNAADKYGRVWALEYDISGVADADIYNKLTGDWTYLCSAFDIKNHPRYLYHNGKPVVVIWGFGFNDSSHPGTTTTATAVINWFKNNGCFVIGGVPGKWRTLDGDSRTESAWSTVYMSFNGITPWTVGRYSSSWSSISSWKSRVVSDISRCSSYGVLYMPTAWPRFGWDNMNNLPAGESHIAPRGGQHLWDQLYAWKSAGATCQFIAMFDEYDESTAVMKLTDNVPTTGSWFTTEGKGEDWYLRLVDWGAKMQRGEIAVSQTIPVSSTTSPDNAQIVSETIPTTMVAQQEYTVSVTVKNTGETCWNADGFKLGGVDDSDPFAYGRQNLPTGTTVMPGGQFTFTFLMTAPSNPGTYTTDWQMVHEYIRWFGQSVTKQVTVTSGPDTIAPRPVTNLTATPGDGAITLSWTNSPSPDSTGTMIRYKLGSYPANAADGSLLTDRAGSPGATGSYVHTGVATGVTYCYSAFAHDAVPNYSTKVDASAMVSDTTPPTSSVDRPSGAYRTPLTLRLSASEPSTIYYTTDGTTPSTSSAVYSSGIPLTSDITLSFFAVDISGNAETVAHTETYKAVAADGSIAAVKKQANGSAVRLGNKFLYWKSGTLGYIEEPDRTSAIRVYAATLPNPSMVCLTGIVRKLSAYEQRIDLDTITPSGSVSIRPLGASIGTAKPIAMAGMYLRLWGVVKQGSVTASTFVLLDGSDGSGLTVSTTYATGVPVQAGDFVGVTGVRAFNGLSPVFSAFEIVHY